MNRIKNLSAAILAMLCIAATASAQTDSKKTVTYPQIFIGVQSGVQTTLTDYNNWKLLTWTSNLSVGSFFTPVVGARLNFSGFQNKGGFRDGMEDFKYKYNFLTSDLDLLVNLVTLFGKKDYYPMNVYLIGGFGLNYAWNNDDAYAHTDKLPLAYEKDHFSHNARIGFQFDYNISKHIGINLEVTANNLKDRYNSKMSNKGDWQLMAQLGLAYKFAAKKNKKQEPSYSSSTISSEVPSTGASSVEEEIWKTRQDTIWYDEVVETPKNVNGTKTWIVSYNVRESDFKAEEQLAGIGAFLKDWRESKIVVKSYADAKTGNSELNMALSKQRCEKAVKALTAAGVPASAITSSYYGDTVQPFAENDKNRVTIITATGQKDDSQKTVVKKFKTKEVRYRVR